MTLLLFLASLGIVHYIVSRQPQARRQEPGCKPPTPTPEAASSSLFALGEALERYGRGAAPRAQAAEKRKERAEQAPVAVKKVTP